MGGIGDIFAEQNHHVGGVGKRSDWAGWDSWAKPMELGTSDSPICVDEPPSEFHQCGGLCYVNVSMGAMSDLGRIMENEPLEPVNRT
jgi:hypothetical protein